MKLCRKNQSWNFRNLRTLRIIYFHPLVLQVIKWAQECCRYYYTAHTVMVWVTGSSSMWHFQGFKGNSAHLLCAEGRREPGCELGRMCWTESHRSQDYLLMMNMLWIVPSFWGWAELWLRRDVLLYYSSSPGAAITKYHKPNGFSNSNLLFPWIWRKEV